MFFLLAELFISFFAPSVPVIEMTNKEFANYYYKKMKFLMYDYGYIIEFCQKTHALSNSSKMYILKKI